MEPILNLVRRRSLKVVEDVAQAFGGRYKGQRLGTLGDAAAFSFFPSKVLGAFGDGGLVVTNSEDVAASARMLRSHGSRRKYYNEVTGYNSRLDALQAAVLRVKLPHVDEYVAGRQRAASRYDRLLARVSGVIAPPVRDYATHVYHQYTVRVPEGRRDAVQALLSAAGIATTIYYPFPLHRLPVYASSGGAFPVAEQAAREVLSLPIWPQMDEFVQRRVVDALAAAVGAPVDSRP
jgi:dTDP-4-amino-4,6-dideoxygalactose transaminase